MNVRRCRPTTVGCGAAPCSATLPLQPNQIPSRRLSAALTATARPPARRGASVPGTATRFETTMRRGTNVLPPDRQTHRRIDDPHHRVALRDVAPQRPDFRMNV